MTPRRKAIKHARWERRHPERAMRSSFLRFTRYLDRVFGDYAAFEDYQRATFDRLYQQMYIPIPAKSGEIITATADPQEPSR